MTFLRNLSNLWDERRLNRLYRDMSSFKNNETYSRTCFITASFLFSLFVTNSAVIYCTSILQHTQTSLALEIVQRALVNPPSKTIYLKNGKFQYINYLSDLEDITLYLKNQKFNSSVNIIQRGGDSFFCVPKLLKPASVLIERKKTYKIITKLFSSAIFLTFIGVSYNGLQYIKDVHQKVLTPVLTNPAKAKRLHQCLTLYLETHNIENIGHLLIRPKLWGDLYQQFLLLSSDIAGLVKAIDYYKFFAYLT